MTSTLPPFTQIRSAQVSGLLELLLGGALDVDVVDGAFYVWVMREEHLLRVSQLLGVELL